MPVMTEETLPETLYNNLLEKIKLEISEGLIRVHNAFDREKVITYWKIGQSIYKYFLENKIQADYGKRIYKNLSRDLNISEPVLYKITQFYKAYPKFEPTLNLKWAHYRILAGVKDVEKRIELEDTAALQNLSIRELEILAKEDEENVEDAKPSEQAISSGLKPKPVLVVSSPAKLRAVKGKLYTYGIFKPQTSENYFIDLGFYISQESDIKKAEKYFIESIKTESGYEKKFISATKKDIYTYKAYILKIIDGDTMWLNIDLGFKTWISHKIRLRGIETAELGTKPGQDALQYVKTALKGVPFVVVKSHGRDKFDRYLMDVYYKPNEQDPYKVLEEGIFLNQELLNKNLAELYSE